MFNQPTQQPINELIFCPHNSARSVLAEAQLNTIGQSRFIAYFGGSSPRVHQQPKCAPQLPPVGPSGQSANHWH